MFSSSPLTESARAQHMNARMSIPGQPTSGPNDGVIIIGRNFFSAGDAYGTQLGGPSGFIPQMTGVPRMQALPSGTSPWASSVVPSFLLARAGLTPAQFLLKSNAEQSNIVLAYYNRPPRLYTANPPTNRDVALGVNVVQHYCAINRTNVLRLVRAAGDATDGTSTDTSSTSTDTSTSSGTSGSSSSSSSGNQSLSGAQIGSLIQQGVAGGVSVANTLISNLSADSRAQLASQTQLQIAALQAQGGSSNNAALQQQIANLEALHNEATQPVAEPATDNTMLYVGLAIAAVAVVGGLFFFEERGHRANPTKANPVRGKGAKRRFHKAKRHAKKTRAKRAGR